MSAKKEVLSLGALEGLIDERMVFRAGKRLPLHSCISARSLNAPDLVPDLTVSNP